MAIQADSPRSRKAHIFEKAQAGWYIEPAWVSRRLFEVEKFHHIIFDPACGWGTILNEAEAAGHQVIGADIVNRKRHRLGERFEKEDFLTCDDPIGCSVVCNPPFDHVREFCERALARGADKVAMICLIRRLNAAHWLQKLPLRRVWLLTPRPSMPPGSWLAAGNKAGGGTQDFVWLVFERGYTGEPAIGWLHRDAEQKREAAE